MLVGYYAPTAVRHKGVEVATTQEHEVVANLNSRRLVYIYIQTAKNFEVPANFYPPDVNILNFRLLYRHEIATKSLLYNFPNISN